MARLDISSPGAVDFGHYRHIRDRNVLLSHHDACNTLPQALGTTAYHQNTVDGAHIRRGQLSQLLFLPTHRLLRGHPRLL